VELSSRVEYALLALLELASHHPKDSPLTVNEITAFQEIPERYLDQILAVLRRAGIVQSLRGAKGGYLLAKEPWQITLLEVFSTLEGDGSGQAKKVSESATIEKTARNLAGSSTGIFRGFGKIHFAGFVRTAGCSQTSKSHVLHLSGEKFNHENC